MAKKEIIVIVELYCGGRVRIVTVGGDPLLHLTTVLAKDEPLPDEPNVIFVKDAEYLFHMEDFENQSTLNCPNFANEVKEILFRYTDALKPSEPLTNKPFKSAGKMFNRSLAAMAFHAPPSSLHLSFFQGHYFGGANQKVNNCFDFSTSQAKINMDRKIVKAKRSNNEDTGLAGASTSFVRGKRIKVPGFKKKINRSLTFAEKLSTKEAIISTSFKFPSLDPKSDSPFFGPFPEDEAKINVPKTFTSAYLGAEIFQEQQEDDANKKREK